MAPELIVKSLIRYCFPRLIHLARAVLFGWPEGKGTTTNMQTILPAQETKISRAVPIPKTMQAAVVEKFGQPLVVREVPVPGPGPGHALVEIIASGVCHTDLHAAEGDWPVKPDLPFTPGHEGAGIVVARGPGVTHLKEGDRVGIAWLHSACGHCEFCHSG